MSLFPAFFAGLFGLGATAAAPVAAPASAPAPAPAAVVAPVATSTIALSTAATLSDEDVFDRAASALDGISTLSADFRQFSPSGAELTGTVSLKRPGLLRIEYDDPSPQLIVANGGLVYVHDKDLETTDSYPVGETPLRYLLTDKLDRDGVELQGVMRGEGEVTLVLVPVDDNLTGQLELSFTDDTYELAGWSVTEANGASTQVYLSDVKTGSRLANRLFRVPESNGFGLRDF